MASGDFENARVDIKRTHEREAIIAEVPLQGNPGGGRRSVQGGAAAARELNGYPVETLNDPEVLALKNGYQNALSHYLAGFMVRSAGRVRPGCPGYRPD